MLKSTYVYECSSKIQSLVQMLTMEPCRHALLVELNVKRRLTFLTLWLIRLNWPSLTYFTSAFVQVSLYLVFTQAAQFNLLTCLRCCLQGSGFFLSGVLVVLYGWAVVGMLLETYGFWLLFSEFFPTVLSSLRSFPVLGRLFGSSCAEDGAVTPSHFLLSYDVVNRLQLLKFLWWIFNNSSQRLFVFVISLIERLQGCAHA